MSNLYQVLFSTLSNRVKLLFINSFLGRLIYIFLELSVLFIASVSMLFILVLVVFLISVCHWDVNEIIDTLLNRNQYHQFWCCWFCLYCPADIVKSQAEAILGLFPFFFLWGGGLCWHWIKWKLRGYIGIFNEISRGLNIKTPIKWFLYKFIFSIYQILLLNNIPVNLIFRNWRLVQLN